MRSRTRQPAVYAMRWRGGRGDRGPGCRCRVSCGGLCWVLRVAVWPWRCGRRGDCGRRDYDSRGVPVRWADVGARSAGCGMTGLPSGAVTFLFSDIEGSTRLVKALRERYAKVLAEHRSLVRAAVADQAGYEVDTQGDAFFIAFAGAKQAVLCALEVQRALARHEWPAGAQVRVRIGIHTGQAVPAGEAYTGLAVHRAARICAAASGGQVLVSQATQTLI